MIIKKITINFVLFLLLFAIFDLIFSNLGMNLPIFCQICSKEIELHQPSDSKKCISKLLGLSGSF